jgi:carotenoid cleavage dioxygenase-like enzyme
MSERESEVNPFLRGNFAPWREEGVVDDLQVIGQIPRDLNGTFFRTGSNPAFEPEGRYHWFDGDGMIHAIRLENGRATYRNRWVESEGLKEERKAGHALYRGVISMSGTEAVARLADAADRRAPIKVTGNTNIVAHAGKLLALVESSLPTEMAPCTLSTVGLYDFGGKLGTAMTAHPKMDPETGEMLFFGYAPFPPFLTYHVADRTGALTRSEAIDVAWPSMMHDFAITKDYVIFMLCPVVFDFESLQRGGSLFSWQPERGAKLGVMPRSGGNADVRWFDIDPCFVFHPMNAFAENGVVTLDVARYEQLLFMDPTSSRDPGWRDKNVARLHRFEIDLNKGAVRSTPLDDGDGEFPRVDERRLGRKHRYGYMALTGPEGCPSGVPVWTSVRKYDLERGTTETRDFGAGNGVGEPLFVPRTEQAAEDDGYVLVLNYDQERDASAFFVLDARDLRGEPLAEIRIPHRVPYGFHGNWVPATH